ncbi:MAG TPA: zinc-binding dehydrogenase [Actinomycetota bacterium]|nr:zinc-binding dehydrogenase [Actinomycetota bacterium]
MTLSLEIYRSVPRYLAARAVGGKLPGMLAGPVAALRLVHRSEPVIDRPGWARITPRLSGVCGSDLTTIAGRSSFYFTALVSMPFVPGHEVVGDLLEACEDLAAGTRVVLDPVLACAARGVEPACEPCARGERGLCERVTGGHLGAGLQTGYCDDTGGGWSQMLTAHRSQLHTIPDGMSDEDAVMVEPLACAIHAVRRANVPRDADVLVAGAGTVGLLTTLALKAETEAARVIVVAKHKHQADLAREFGADEIVSPDQALGSIRRSTGAFRLHPERSGPFLLGGVDVAFDAAGSKSTLDLALRSTKARGTVVLAGMPAKADLTPAWFRELTLTGAYSGAGCFADAIEMAAGNNVGRLVGAAYPLERWREAIDHALEAGRLGTVKVVFKPEGPRALKSGGVQ